MLYEIVCLQSGNNIMHLAVYREKTELIKMILHRNLICADSLNSVRE